MTVSTVLDSAGRRRSPATMPGYHAGRPPRNKGLRYPADPPTVQEIIAVMREAGTGRHGACLRALIVVLWRGGLRIQEALALSERDLDPQRGSVLVRNGKGGRRREIGMDAWGWEQMRPWLTTRVELPVGPMFCIIDGPTRGRPWSSAAVRSELRRLAAQAGVRRRFAPPFCRCVNPGPEKRGRDLHYGHPGRFRWLAGRFAGRGSCRALAPRSPTRHRPASARRSGSRPRRRPRCA
jgi:integrase